MSERIFNVPFWYATKLHREKVIPDGFVVRLEDLESWTGRFIRDEGEIELPAEGSAFQPGDVLFGKLRPYLAKYWYAVTSGAAIGDIHVYRPNEKVVIPRFLFHLVSSSYFVENVNSVSTGTKMPRSEWQSFRSLPIFLPPLDEQHRIADYLDAETDEIDSTVAKLDELIEDLRIRRATTLEQATSSAMSLSPSGADFKQLKFELDTRFAGDWGEDEGKLDVDIHCVRVADFDRSTNSATDDVPTIRSVKKQTLNAKHLVDGDILLEKSGGGEKTPVGDAMLYRGGNSAICSNFIEVVRPTQKHDSRYWTYLLSAGYASGETRTIIKQTTGIQNLDLQRYFDRVKFLPPLDEQRRIADYLDKETARIDKMKTTASKLRDELLARRKTIITEAVTGQKRVR